MSRLSVLSSGQEWGVQAKSGESRRGAKVTDCEGLAEGIARGASLGRWSCLCSLDSSQHRPRSRRKIQDAKA